MDVGIDTENEPIEVVDVDLIFRKPIEITNFELVKTFWIDPSETINSIEHPSEPLPPSQPDQESKQLQPLALNALSAEEDEGSSCSHSDGDQLPEEVLNESMDDDVFEEEIEDVETDLLFRHPENRDMELVYTISKGATVNLDELEDEDEDVDVDLWFREPTDTRFELVYTIPLMEDVSVDSFGDTLEDVPPPEELDNVVEEAAEFTFKPIENDEEKTETDTLTTEVVTVLERRTEENVGEGSRDFIEKVKLTSNDTFDEFDGEEEAFQNAFVKSVETPETPVPEGDQEETEDASVSDVLKDAAEKLKIIQESETTDLSADRNTVESEDAVKETASAPDILESSEEEIPEVSDKLRDDAVESEDLKAEKVEESTEGVVESNDDISSEVLPVPQNSEISTDENVISSEVANDLNEEYDANGNPISPADIKETTDETENRFNVDPVEETSVPSAPEEDVAKPLRVESESTISDFAQLESVYAEDVPDVYKTLDSLRNEDIFPKEDTPAAVPDIPTIEVTPEAESQKPDEEKAQAELKLEDSGILETPGTAEVNETDIKETLNAEDVFTGISEELPSDDQKIDISEGMETVIKLEDSGISATPVLKEEGAKKALKSEDAGSDFPETVAPEDEFQLQNELKLEDSGISEIPNIDGTNESEIKNALNEEDVIETSEERPSEDDNDGVTPEVPESQNPNEATPIGNENEVVTVIKLEDSGIIDTPVLEKK
uniref:Titin-like n=1 Tax=Caenorhabditis tropicalis TaxID=1561998 RepID=A0A1I7U8D5_9PELO